MGVSRTMWLRGLSEDHAKMRHNAVNERDADLSQLENIRRNNIKVLEAEHKASVAGCWEKYKAEIVALDAEYKSEVAQGPPKY